MDQCAHAGCRGMVEDGYCAVCGLAPSKLPPPTRVAVTHGNVSRRLGAAPARPPLPRRDPLTALVAGEVPARRRVCSSCATALSRDAGFCPTCGREYAFKPTLVPGDRVAEKYEVKGTVAFGGLGWIYLALDTVLGRWVILKGLLDSNDPRMLEVAVQEREYLAAVKHPSIVGIHDFVTGGRDGNEGFIVLEYVNGKTLMTLRREAGGPLPPAQACAYIRDILPALGYLDELGLVYCDFKPENVMVEDETVKLIDLGAVRPVGATEGDVYGSDGYTAPEAHEAPTPRSDLYSVGRALAVLVATFDFQGRYAESLPPPAEVPLFAQEDALYRFLLKATRNDPAERFQSAAEMRGQLVGVMRSLVDKDDHEVPGHLARSESALFEGDDERAGRPDGFPRLRVDREDEGAAIVLAAGALADPERRRAMFARAVTQMPSSMELKLRLVDELCTLGRFVEAGELQQTAGLLAASRGGDFRVGWYRGRMLFAQRRTDEALAAFEQLAADLPGELAPRYVLGLMHERAAELGMAVTCYDRVSRADPTFASATLGLARCRERQGDRAAALEAYRRVPSTSHRYVTAQLALATLLLSDVGGGPTATDLEQAGEAAAALDPLADGLAKHELRANIFTIAARVRAGGGETILGVPWDPRALRRAAEQELRTCARFVDGDRKIALIDRANAVRPLTWT